MTSNLPKLLVSTLAIGFFVIATGGSDTNAHENSAHEHTITEQNRMCRAIENDYERLSCYDRINIELATISNAAPTASIIRQTPDSSAPDANGPDPETFGLPTPTTTNSENGDQQSVRIVITSFAKNPHGEILFYTSNGQVWQQKDNTRVFLRQGESPSATISQSSFGGYRLKIDGKRPKIRVKRIR